MLESLGARLRELREAQNLTLEQLYVRTKILPKYIEALENGRWDLLPGQIYVKPFVKSLSDALNADYKELCALIDKQSPKTENGDTAAKRPLPVESISKKGFEYRWLATIGLLAFSVIAVYLFIKIANSRSTYETSAKIPIVEHKANGYFTTDRFTSQIDYVPSLFAPSDYRYLTLTAIDSVELKLIAGTDTLFNGILPRGKTIKHKSIKSFVLEMKKSDCLDIEFDGQKMNQSEQVKYKKSVKFPGSETALAKLADLKDENK
jgi:transcriptional regulator with XRE-family HTH domain